MDDIKIWLNDRLRKIYDNDDFVNSIFNRLPEERKLEELYKFINYADNIGDEVTHDMVIQLSFIIKNKELKD